MRAGPSTSRPTPPSRYIPPSPSVQQPKKKTDIISMPKDLLQQRQQQQQQQQSNGQIGQSHYKTKGSYKMDSQSSQKATLLQSMASGTVQQIQYDLPSSMQYTGGGTSTSRERPTIETSYKPSKDQKQVTKTDDLEAIQLQNGHGFLLSTTCGISIQFGSDSQLGIYVLDTTYNKTIQVSFYDHQEWLQFAYQLIPKIMQGIISGQVYTGRGTSVGVQYDPQLNSVQVQRGTVSIRLNAKDIELLNRNVDFLSTKWGVPSYQIEEMKVVKSYQGRSNSTYQLFQQLSVGAKEQSEQEKAENFGEQNINSQWMVNIDGKNVKYENLRDYMSKSGRDQKEAQMIMHELDDDLQVRQSQGRQSDDLLFSALTSTTNTDGYLRLTQDLQQQIRSSLNKVEQVDVPSGMPKTLREYQIEGYRWMTSNLSRGFGVLLSDEMGLGKTIQVITTIAYLTIKRFILKPALVVVPLAVLTQWQQEIEKFAPFLRVITLDKTKSLRSILGKYDVIVTTYGVARSNNNAFINAGIECVVIDEAQKIKNHSSGAARSLKNLASVAKYRIAITGTPIENTLQELHSIFEFTNPSVFGDLDRFTQQYMKPIMFSKSDFNRQEALKKLQTVTKPFMLRRLKQDPRIKLQLPSKIIREITCYLTPRQISAYKSISSSKLQILHIIQKLKAICNHLGQYQRETYSLQEPSGKMNTLLNILDDILGHKGYTNKVLIFSQFVTMIDVLQEILSARGYNVLTYTGRMSNKERVNVREVFDKDPKFQILIVSLKAGGVGLNLTAANYVIHYDLWWNPAVENQATDRVHRIGQERNVTVFRLITKGTIEERIDKLFKRKVELQDASLTTGSQYLSKMNKEEIGQLLELTSEARADSEEYEEI